MLSEDYIMRMISQALAVLMTALGLKKAGKFKEALQTFDQAIENLLGFDANLVNQLEDGMLLDRLNFMGILDADRAQILGDIYREEAEIYETLGQTEKSFFMFQRSLRLFLEATLACEADIDVDLIRKTETLRRRISILHLSVETRMALQDYIDRLLVSSNDLLFGAGISRQSLKSDLAALDNLGSN